MVGILQNNNQLLSENILLLHGRRNYFPKLHDTVLYSLYKLCHMHHTQLHSVTVMLDLELYNPADLEIISCWNS